MDNSYKLIKSAEKIIPGGVNSPVRAFKAVGASPKFIKNAIGPYLYDVDNNKYIDYIMSWGPSILGHCNEIVNNKIKEAIDCGLSFGAPTEIEIILASKIIELMPAIEMVRMVNSGTEATMSALRLARGYTNRDKIIKFNGCYHGHSDSLLVKAGSGALTFGSPNSLGVPKDFVKNTFSIDFNDLDQVESCFKNNPDEIAAIILEPIAGNMNLILPKPGYLEGLRNLCDKYGALLIFDEVMTGFRVSLGGASQYYNIKPDLICLGKIIGGGMPVGAFGGKKEIMQKLSPIGPVYQAGTLSGNPIAMTAGYYTLLQLEENAKTIYPELVNKTKYLSTKLKIAANKYNVEFNSQHICGFVGLYFTSDEINSLTDIQNSNIDFFNQFFRTMLKLGIYLPPSAYETAFLSITHSYEDLDKTISCAEQAFKILGNLNEQGSKHLNTEFIKE